MPKNTVPKNTVRKDLVRVSKFLSLVLRHQPETLGLALDPEGWIEIEALLAAADEYGESIDRALVDEVVLTNDKQRFAFSADGRKIRANQGHSVAVELNLQPQAPPERLFHGTARRFLDSIRATGLESRNRNHVHLSATEATAISVGQRHGRPVVLSVRSGDMARDGQEFFLSRNGVWLTRHVPVKYIEVYDEA